MTDRQIFWSGGIGDIFALESTFTDEDRASIRRMYWATRARASVAPLFTRLPTYKNLIEHVSLWDEFPAGFCFPDLESVMDISPNKHKLVGTVEDWSVLKRFCNHKPFTNSSFLKYRTGNIVRFHLPQNYVTICPYSDVNADHIRRWRRFQEGDWQWVLDQLRSRDIKGVVLNTGTDLVPEDESLVDLSNRTNLGEAIEVVKRSCGYYGIDSCFSILASQLFSPDEMRVATLNKIYWLCRKNYCLSQEDFSFIVPWMGATEEERTEWIRRSEASLPEISAEDLPSATITASPINEI